MKEKRENKLLKVVAGTTLVAAVGVTLLSGTYAKYTSSGTGSDTARVAKWSFKVGDTTDIATTDKFAFNIFNTVKSTNGADENALADTTGTIIAPGTMGSFKIAVKNESEVSAEYTVDYSIENTSKIPLEFIKATDLFVNGKDGAMKENPVWSTKISDVNQTATKLGFASPNNSGETVEIYWRWAFSSGKYLDGDTTKTATDEYDTALGKASTAAANEDAAPKAIVTARITATQVD